MVRAKPKISSPVSPLVRSPMRKAPACTSLTCPFDDQLEHARSQIGVEVAARGELVEHARHQRYGDRVQGFGAADHEIVEEIDQFGMGGDGLLDLVATVLQEVLRGHTQYVGHGRDGVGLERPLAADLFAQGLVLPAIHPAEERAQVDPRPGVALLLSQKVGQGVGEALLRVVQLLIGGIDHTTSDLVRHRGLAEATYYIGVVITTEMLTCSDPRHSVIHSREARILGRGLSLARASDLKTGRLARSDAGAPERFPRRCPSRTRTSCPRMQGGDGRESRAQSHTSAGSCRPGSSSVKSLWGEDETCIGNQPGTC